MRPSRSMPHRSSRLDAPGAGLVPRIAGARGPAHGCSRKAPVELAAAPAMEWRSAPRWTHQRQVPARPRRTFAKRPEWHRAAPLRGLSIAPGWRSIYWRARYSGVSGTGEPCLEDGLQLAESGVPAPRKGDAGGDFSVEPVGAAPMHAPQGSIGNGDSVEGPPTAGGLCWARIVSAIFRSHVPGGSVPAIPGTRSLSESHSEGQSPVGRTPIEDGDYRHFPAALTNGGGCSRLRSEASIATVHCPAAQAGRVPRWSGKPRSRVWMVVSAEMPPSSRNRKPGSYCPSRPPLVSRMVPHNQIPVLGARAESSWSVRVYMPTPIRHTAWSGGFGSHRRFGPWDVSVQEKGFPVPVCHDQATEMAFMSADPSTSKELRLPRARRRKVLCTFETTETERTSMAVGDSS